MRRLPEAERVDATQEIRSHIAESQARGEPIAAVLGRLGEPSALARAYLSDYYLRTEGTSPGMSRFVSIGALGLVLGTGLVSVIVVPLLATLTVVLGLAAVASPVFGILRTLGAATWLVLGNNPGWQVPRIWSLPVLLGLGVLSGLLAWLALGLLRRYINAVLLRYRRMLSAHE